MAPSAREIGDPPRDTVLKLCLSLDGLRWLVGELEAHNFRDRAVEELRQALNEIEAEESTQDE